jgi:hypothetical protein
MLVPMIERYFDWRWGARVLLQAFEYPFKKVIGVEFVPGLLVPAPICRGAAQ